MLLPNKTLRPLVERTHVENFHRVFLSFFIFFFHSELLCLLENCEANFMHTLILVLGHSSFLTMVSFHRFEHVVEVIFV